MLIDDDKNNNSNIKVTIKAINELITNTCTKLGLKNVGVKGIDSETESCQQVLSIFDEEIIKKIYNLNKEQIVKLKDEAISLLQRKEEVYNELKERNLNDDPLNIKQTEVEKEIDEVNTKMTNELNRFRDNEKTIEDKIKEKMNDNDAIIREVNQDDKELEKYLVLRQIFLLDLKEKILNRSIDMEEMLSRIDLETEQILLQIEHITKKVPIKKEIKEDNKTYYKIEQPAKEEDKTKKLFEEQNSKDLSNNLKQMKEENNKLKNELIKLLQSNIPTKSGFNQKYITIILILILIGICFLYKRKIFTK